MKTLIEWRRARDSNPRSRFSDLHDFQSCSFDQLGQLSIYFLGLLYNSCSKKSRADCCFTQIFLKEKPPLLQWFSFSGADDEARTRYLHLGKVALYQMSYIRIWCLRPESNQRHVDFQSTALPTELQRQKTRTLLNPHNGDPERARTVDLQRDRLAF